MPDFGREKHEGEARTSPTRWQLVVVQGRPGLRVPASLWRRLEAGLEPGGLLFVCNFTDPRLAAQIKAASDALQPGEWHLISPAGEDRWRLCPDSRAAEDWFTSHVAVPYGLRNWLRQSIGSWFPYLLASSPKIRSLPFHCGSAKEADAGTLLGGVLAPGQLSEVVGRPINSRFGFIYEGDPNEAPQRQLLFVIEPGKSRPCAVVKWARRSSAQSLYNEREALERLRAHNDRTLEVRSPRCIGPLRVDADNVVTVQSYLPGRSLYSRFRTSPWPRSMVAEHFRATGDWLARFHRATRQPARPLDEAVVYEQIEQPLAEARRYFGSKVVPDAQYAATMRQARMHLGCSVSLVDEHGDFWPSNLLLAQGQLRVIDWEHFRPAMLPGFDMLVFCAAYSMHFPWRPFSWADVRATFDATFLRETWMSKYAMSLLDRGCASSGLPHTLVPVMLTLTLCRMAVRRTQAASQDGSNAPTTSWLQMLEDWWQRPAGNRLEAWAHKKALGSR